MFVVVGLWRLITMHMKVRPRLTMPVMSAGAQVVEARSVVKFIKGYIMA
jgi:hypothetical protein